MVITVVCASSVACALVTNLGDLTAGVDAAACDASGACSAAKVPPGWTAVAFHEGFVGCPDGFTSQKFVTNPIASCTCGCTVTTQPNCTTGSIPTTSGSTSSCGQPGETANVDGGCLGIVGTLATYFEGTPLAPAGAKCTTQATADASTTSAEACIPNSCGDAICQGVVPQGFKACVMNAGDLPCPSGTPFTVVTRVGVSADVTCGTGCACTVSAACEAGTFTLYTDSACKTQLTTLPVDGKCVPTGENAMAVGSLKYTAIGSASCAVQGTSDPDASFAGVHTVCCAP